jgi:hypothetical protein
MLLLVSQMTVERGKPKKRDWEQTAAIIARFFEAKAQDPA